MKYLRETFANVLVFILDNLTFPFRWTGTIETILAARAGAAIGAGIASAIVDGAVGWITHETGIANALGSVSVFHADAVKRTGGIFAEASQFAMATGESRRTFAMVSAHIIDAFATVDTGPGQTLV